MNTRLTSLFLFPLLLGGCLLPQPDTPPIGGKPTASRPAGGSVSTGTPLLPQPDTPPVGAVAKGGGQENAVAPNNGAGINPGAATAGANDGAVTAPNTLAPTASASAAPAPSGSPAAPGKLSGKITGAVVKGITVTDESGSTTYQTAAVGSDGSFSFALAPGRYLLVLLTDKDETLKPSQVFTVSSGESRTYTIELKDHTDATVSEQAPLASPSPTPKAP